MHNPRFVPLTIQVPTIFVRLAHHYKLSPERLLSALAYSFCLRPPTSLRLIERAEAPQGSSALRAFPSAAIDRAERGEQQGL